MYPVKFFYISLLVVSFLSFLCALGVLLDVLRERRFDSFGGRFPLYFAIIDLGVFITFFPDYWLQILGMGNPVGWLCMFEGITKKFITECHLSLQFFVSIVVYLRCCRNYLVKLGKWDWKLWLFIIICSLVVISLNLLLKVTSDNNFTCLLKPAINAPAYVKIILLLIFLVKIAVILICHKLTTRRIEASLRYLSAYQAIPLETLTRERTLTEKRIASTIPLVDEVEVVDLHAFPSATSATSAAYTGTGNNYCNEVGPSSPPPPPLPLRQQQLMESGLDDLSNDLTGKISNQKVKMQSMIVIQRYLFANLSVWLPSALGMVLRTMGLDGDDYWFIAWMDKISFAFAGVMLAIAYLTLRKRV